jgi:nitrate/TMAO reductase-like tetraheme cytochrome c subunit
LNSRLLKRKQKGKDMTDERKKFEARRNEFAEEEFDNGNIPYTESLRRCYTAGYADENVLAVVKAAKEIASMAGRDVVDGWLELQLRLCDVVIKYEGAKDE